MITKYCLKGKYKTTPGSARRYGTVNSTIKEYVIIGRAQIKATINYEISNFAPNN
jgi:hypothetical protein